MTKKLILPIIFVIALLFLLMASPFANQAKAAGIGQDVEGCLECHSTAYTPWAASKHGQGNVNCLVCHKLSPGTGTHPTVKYTVEDESVTCVVCHTNVAGTNVAGQLEASKHGEVGLKCITCHEPHSQSSILSAGSTIVCDNCHKTEMNDAKTSTHHAAGLNCINCHMGEERSHTLKIGPETCGGCHSDIHSANRILSSGAKVQPITTPMVNPEDTQNVTEETEPVVQTQGINLPSWILVIAGVIIGAVTTWVLFGREPGQPKRPS